VIENIQELYNNPDPRIKLAREYSDKLNLHVNGVGLSDALEKINNYENENQKIARDKFAISNKFITDRLLRPTDNVFSAKGGYENYIFSTNEDEAEKDFKNKLKDIYSGYSLSQYIHRIWFDKYIVDPNGLIFIEVDPDGELVYPCYKSIHSIRNYKQDGIKVSWVIFEPDEFIFEEEKKQEEKEVKEEFFWAVDPENYYRCSSKKEEIIINKTIPHIFGQVPAVICSDIEDHVTGWKKSSLDQQIELLSKFMVDNSVLNIVDFMHSYPQQWMYVSKCPSCNGTGISTGRILRDGTTDTTCPNCSGSGKASRKDVTDIIEMTPPEKEEQKIDPPSGYVYMPTDAWKLKVDSVDRCWNIIIFSHWGTSLENKGNDYATATGRFIDTQPVNNKLNRYTDSVELIHNSLADLYGKFYYPQTFNKSNVVYGRRYLIETPDQLISRYKDFIGVSDNAVFADITYEQYLESEFRGNDQLYEYNSKIAALDPFPHYKLSDLVSLNMPEELKKKLFVIDFKNTMEIGYVLSKTKEELKKEYEEFLSSKESQIINNLKQQKWNMD